MGGMPGGGCCPPPCWGAPPPPRLLLLLRHTATLWYLARSLHSCLLLPHIPWLHSTLLLPTGRSTLWILRSCWASSSPSGPSSTLRHLRRRIPRLHIPLRDVLPLLQGPHILLAAWRRVLHYARALRHGGDELVLLLDREVGEVLDVLRANQSVHVDLAGHLRRLLLWVVLHDGGGGRGAVVPKRRRRW